MTTDSWPKNASKLECSAEEHPSQAIHKSRKSNQRRNLPQMTHCETQWVLKPTSYDKQLYTIIRNTFAKYRRSRLEIRVVQRCCRLLSTKLSNCRLQKKCSSQANNEVNTNSERHWPHLKQRVEIFYVQILAAKSLQYRPHLRYNIGN